MRIEQGSTVQDVALKTKHCDANTSIEFVGAPGVTVQKTGFRDEKDYQLFILTLTIAKNAPLGNRSILVKNSKGVSGPARYGLLEVVPPKTLGK
jgi:hypothetical protein